MKSISLFLVLGAAAAAWAQTPPPKPPDGLGGGLRVESAQTLPAPADPNMVIMTVGDEKITLKQYNDLIQSLPPQVQAAARGPQKRAFAERIVEVKLLSKKAERENLEQTPAVKEQLAFQRQQILANAAYQEMIKAAKVDDTTVHKYYDDHKVDYEMAKGHHILIRMKGSPVALRAGQKELSDEEALAKAQEIRKKLQDGGDFDALAKAESDDTGSGAKGGDLGSFKHGQMVGPFDQAAFSIPVKQISEPVKTQFGYHIIRVDERTSTPFETVRNEIVAKLAPEAAKKDLEELRKKSDVKLDDAFFGPAPPAGPAQ